MDAGDKLKTVTGGASDGAVGSFRVRRLLVVAGPARGTRHRLDAEPVTIGRAGHCEGPLALGDPEISRQHARIEPEPAGGWSVVDLGSRNGTFVDGGRCQGRCPLRDGSVIRAGTSLLLFEDVEVPAYTQLEPEQPSLPGPSLGMQRVRGEVKLVAPKPLPVLILGETGTGKELVAEELHRQSGRTGAFVPVNCAAISPQIAESELFGHAAGAFTGAVRKSEGLFSAANGGTLFLDEVGEMPLELQPKLLRALAKGEFRPVGSAETLRADVRILAATHRDLAAAVQADTFRGDLLARLKAWTLKVPPLRERQEDVLALATRFLERAQPPCELTVDAAEALLLHDWPYNVRELEQVLSVAAVRAGGSPIRREHLPPELAARLRDRAFAPARSEPAPPPLELLVPRDRPPSRDELCQVLERMGGNMAQVAEFFGKDRRQVYRWAEKLGVDPEAFRRD